MNPTANPKRALIIQTAFIGDVILTTPLIKNLKKIYPDIEIDFLTIPVSKNLVEKDPNIRQLIIFDKRGEDKGLKGLIRLGKQLKQNEYDLCLCPHRSFRSAVLSWYSRANIRIGFENSALRYVFNRQQKYSQDLHETERNLSIAYGLYIRGIKPNFYWVDNQQSFLKYKGNVIFVDNTTIYEKYQKRFRLIKNLLNFKREIEEIREGMENPPKLTNEEEKKIEVCENMLEKYIELKISENGNYVLIPKYLITWYMSRERIHTFLRGQF